MSAEEASVCPHTKYLLKEQNPQIRGVITTPCKHRAPEYYLGWTIPFDDISKRTTGAHKSKNPWYKSYGKKYRNNIQHCYCNPYFTLMHLDRTKHPDDLHMVVFISHNRDEEGIAFSENQEFINDMRRMTHIDESITAG
ncbi:hypothetical protein BDP27DRAFT_1369068 [Rhodocollybia butyracea]|uniref:Uncharacterized protein n=1 Tax=Rhodocollybia butyracea TaxID=206335 RepID=A0A9P5PFD5_9AGAR|nr:hypothetical protein BDP27DRAFT_1369068 [Rhodocollybia butyracea]